jgi:hypothetical protein
VRFLRQGIQVLTGGVERAATGRKIIETYYSIVK